MADDPKFVRLATRLQKGMVADVHGSGWSISGLDVRNFPKDKQAQRYVRSRLNSGHLEAASRSEWEEAHDQELEKEILSQNPDYRENASAVQESRIQRAAQSATDRLAEKRGVDLEAEEDALRELEAEDRAARLAEQNEADLMTDDPKKQKARSTGQAPRKRNANGKSKKKADDSPKE